VAACRKVASQLLAFFKSDPTAAPWFLRSSITGAPPSVTVSANVTSGYAPIAVNFSASASDPDGTIASYRRRRLPPPKSDRQRKSTGQRNRSRLRR
jgi:hypothetical protein